MAFPDAKLVEPRWRPLACIFPGFVIFLALTYVCWSFYDIWSNRFTPPTITTTIDGAEVGPDGKSLWGFLPPLRFAAFHGTEISSAKRGDPWGGPICGANMVDAHGGTGKFSMHMNAHHLTVNMSEVQPRFGNGLVKYENWDKFRCAFRFRVNVKDNEPKVSVSLDGDDYGTTIWHRHSKNGNSPLQIVALSVKKAVSPRVSPREGVYWGFFWEDEHTQTRYYLSVDGDGFPNDDFVETETKHFVYHENLLVYLRVNDPLISVTRPVGLLVQFMTILSSVGGYVALYGTVFYMVFVRKRAVSRAEALAAQLTIVGHSEVPFQPVSNLCTILEC